MQIPDSDQARFDELLRRACLTAPVIPKQSKKSVYPRYSIKKVKCRLCKLSFEGRYTLREHQMTQHTPDEFIDKEKRYKCLDPDCITGNKEEHYHKTGWLTESKALKSKD